MAAPGSNNPSRRRVLAALAALPGLHGATGARAQAATMQENPVTAIDIALEPDERQRRNSEANAAGS